MSELSTRTLGNGEAPLARAPGRAPLRWLRSLIDVAMPPVCLSCQTRLVEHHALCAACWGNTDFIRPPLCDRLGVPMPYAVADTMVSAAAAADPPAYDRARAVGLYSGSLKTLVHDLKFRDRQELRRLFVRWLLDAGAPFWERADMIVPVPLHRRRMLRRRFNQAALLGRDLSRATGVGYEPLLLQRTRATAQQIGLTRQQRQDNVRGAFTVADRHGVKLHQARIVLLDDVVTSGATVEACTKALRRAGAAHIDVLALALAGYGALEREGAGVDAGS